jgi:hypothetical protein
MADALHLAVVRFSFYIIFCQRDVRHSGETAREYAHAPCILRSQESEGDDRIGARDRLIRA